MERERKSLDEKSMELGEARVRVRREDFDFRRERWDWRIELRSFPDWDILWLCNNEITKRSQESQHENSD